MKLQIVMLALGTVSFFACAEKIKNSDVPAEVMAAFKNQYPKATDVKWEKEKENYEANFDSGKSDYSVLYDAKGMVIETEVEIDVKQLPVGVAEYVKANYKGESIEEAAQITDANGVVTYEAEADDLELFFDNNGKFIKKANKD